MIACAGHPAPFLNGSELPLPGALPLGITPNASYKESAISLQAGDHLSLYTDGLLEARSASGEIYGFDRLRISSLLSRTPRRPPKLRLLLARMTTSPCLP